MTQICADQIQDRGTKQRVLRINYIMPRPNLGGGIKSSKLIAEAMVRRGHDVRIIYCNKPVGFPPIWRVRSFLKTLRHRMSAMGGLRLHHLMQSTAKLIPVDKHRLEPADVPDADVSMASWWETMEMIHHWPANKGLKVHYIRGHEVFHREKERVRNVYLLERLKIVNSYFLQKVMREEYGRESVVVHNGVDWKQFDTPLRPRPAIPTIGFVVARSPYKGATTAFAAIRMVQEQMPQVRVTCFGMEDLETSWVLPANFQYEKYPSQARIAEIYRGASCWIIPSLTEGLPMPGLEAAACRCPIVATRCGGSEDYVRDGVNGYLVEVENPTQMAERLLAVLRASDTEWEQMSRIGYQIAREFDWDLSAQVLERTFLEQLDRATS